MMKKKSKLFFALMLMSFCAIASDTTLVLNTPGGDITLKVPAENVDSTVNDIVEALAKLANDGIQIGQTIKEEKPQGAMDWVLLLLTGLLPVVTSFVVRFTRTIKSIASYFKDNNTLAIVSAVSAILAAVYELIINGYGDAFFNNWAALFCFAFAGSMTFYELILKKVLGKTPKV
jgi:hypothetical protein